MLDQLTGKEFRAFVAHFDDTMRALADTLDDHTRRLDRLEKLLDLEQRLDRFESDVRTKFRKVGEHLAIPEITV
jgi:hypothetical protein